MNRSKKYDRINKPVELKISEIIMFGILIMTCFLQINRRKIYTNLAFCF